MVAVLGYGVQGPAQALNMRDNGINVIVGVNEGGKSWEKALAKMAGFPGNPFLSGRSCRTRNRHPVPGFRCCPENDLAKDQTSPAQG